MRENLAFARRKVQRRRGHCDSLGCLCSDEMCGICSGESRFKAVTIAGKPRECRFVRLAVCCSEERQNIVRARKGHGIRRIDRACFSDRRARFGNRLGCGRRITQKRVDARLTQGYGALHGGNHGCVCGPQCKVARDRIVVSEKRRASQERSSRTLVCARHRQDTTPDPRARVRARHRRSRVPRRPRVSRARQAPYRVSCARSHLTADTTKRAHRHRRVPSKWPRARTLTRLAYCGSQTSVRR